MKLCIGSRESRLAVIQSQLVMDRLCRARPDLSLELVTMKTSGDRILDRTLDQVGGKGLFVKELEAALLSGRVDLCVHSCKDLPMEEDPRLPIGAYTCREDPRDVLVLAAGLRELDLSRPIGCSSLRRTLQLKELFPRAEILPVRGNVLTRLRKLDEGQFGALVLAAAGIKRLGLEERISRFFSSEEILPAAGQGILAVQCRRDMDEEVLSAVRDREGTLCALAERAFVRALGGGCSSPVAAYATLAEGAITIRGLYADDNNRLFRGTVSGSPEEGETLAARLAAELKEATLCAAK